MGRPLLGVQRRSTLWGMEQGWLHRARWRLRGAWLWPTFLLAVLVEGVALTRWPIVGDGQSFPGALLSGLIVSVLAVAAGARPFGALLRRRRPDLPAGVARDYAGTTVVALAAVALVGIGVARHGGIVARRHARHEAVVRAMAYIDLHAPLADRGVTERVDVLTIQDGEIYRVCIPTPTGMRDYCVTVNVALPPARSVRPAGTEPNALLGQGTD